MSKPTISRRAAIKGAAASAALGCAGSAPSTKSNMTDSGSVEPGSVDHIIVIMMENRSFDHWYGSLSLEEGKAVDGLTADMVNLAPDGTEIHPFPVPDPCMSDPPHGWTSTHKQIAEGTMDGFCTEYAARIGGNGAGAMSYHKRADIPISYALADAYTICDRWFSSVPGPTWPNRLFAHMASSEGYSANQWPEDTLGFTDPTIWKGLESAGHEWRYYFSDLPFIGLLRDHFTADRCRPFEDFFRDVEAGNLPAVTWIDPAFSYNDNHPPHHPARGEMFIAAIHEAIATSPVWERCLVILTYDEHGGFFDHVPPPTTADSRASDGFDQMGVRVPTVVMGPWIKPGVDSTVYDHTSWIRYAAERFGVPLWNERLEAANSIEGILDTERMARGEPLPPTIMPAFELPPEALDEACDYGRRGPPTHLLRQAQWLKERGLPVRFDAPEEIEALLEPILRRRGLIG
jgi:phospholipase C